MNHRWLFLLFCSPVSLVTAAEKVDYLQQVKPILVERCVACHGALKQEGKLRLDTAIAIKRGGTSGPAINATEPAKSLLLERVCSADDDDRMPPEGEPLKPTQIAAIKQWIAEGANAPANEQAERDPREHWAFNTPVKPAIPKVANPQWSRNPIDAFIAADWEKQGLKPQPFADKRTWLRRVTIDLTGLPPTLKQQEDYLQDTSTTADAKVINRLLATPQYGERWGRHWMDIWRYSDWWGLGAEVRNSQKHMWHWRDWIIESLNSDKGYDQMLREMVAADELYPNDLDRLRASGYLARQYFKFNRTSWLDETIEHTAKGMLGLTFNCAKCHDHKYDPISQMDYYRLRAVFEPYQVRTEILPGTTDIEKNGLPRAFDCNLDAKTFLHIRGDDRNPNQNAVIEPRIPAVISQPGWNIQSVNLPPEAYQPGLRSYILDTHRAAVELRISEAKAALANAKRQLALAQVGVTPAKEPTDATANSANTGKTIINDDFTKETPNRWKPISGQWKFVEGKLTQTEDGAKRHALNLISEIPGDFEATLKYRVTGGQQWKSVGIAFDIADGHEVLAYASAVNSGAKTQIAYKNGGDYIYLNDAMQLRPFEVNKPYELRIRVRGDLINLSINNDLSVAYRLPIPRRRGALHLITFDAKAEFTGFELKELPTTIILANATPSAAPVKPTQPLTREQAEFAVIHAEKALAHAEAMLPSLQARYQADQAKYGMTNQADAANLARAASKQERRVNLAKAEETAAKADLDWANAAPANKPALDKARQTAKANVATAQKAMDVASESYTSLVGAIKTLESTVETEASRNKPFPKTSTGRRTAFAQWLTSVKNPLTARVAVNHIWARHFGKPLVPTVFDFGRKGTPPTNQALLDWLACELMEHQWSMKHIQRLLLTANVYRLSSSSAKADPATVKNDPDNKFYWRANPIRLDAQAIRDNLLSMADELDLTRGGPSIPANDTASKRRSLYFFHSHNEHHQFLSLFDDANVLDCYRRAESIVPQQALALENSPLAYQMAVKIASKLSTTMPKATDREWLQTAFRVVLSTEPTDAELTLAEEGLKQFAAVAKEAKRPNPTEFARIGLIQALLNHNDFVTVR